MGYAFSLVSFVLATDWGIVSWAKRTFLPTLFVDRERSEFKLAWLPDSSSYFLYCSNICLACSSTSRSSTVFSLCSACSLMNTRFISSNWA